MIHEPGRAAALFDLSTDESKTTGRRSAKERDTLVTIADMPIGRANVSPSFPQTPATSSFIGT